MSPYEIEDDRERGDREDRDEGRRLVPRGVDGEETKYGRRGGDRREHDGGVRAGVGAPAVARDGDE